MPLRRVGHKGADLIAPGNTADSFDAALEAGVDMIEFDVLPENRDGSGRLVLAHDYSVLDDRRAITLEEGLDHFAGERFTSTELDVDLKLPGYELRVLDALRERGLLERSLVSSMERSSLSVLREAEPTLRLGWSVPKLRRDPTRNPLIALPAYALLTVYRELLPNLASAALRSGAVDALMVHWRLVTERLVHAVTRPGGEIYAWTVDDARQIERLEALGVTGVITNDPRLFAVANATAART